MSLFSNQKKKIFVYRLKLQAYNSIQYIFLLDVNFDKFTIGLHFLLYPPCLQNFKKIKYQ